MVEIINLIAAIVIIIGSLMSLSGYAIAENPLDPREKIKVFPLTRFLTFSVMTSMFFLGPYSMIKYGWWIMVLIVLCLKSFKFKFNVVILIYLLFVGWTIYSAIFIAPYKGAAFNMVIKYLLPIGYLYLSYNGIDDEEDLMYFLKKSTYAIFIYTILIGGFAQKALKAVYLFCGIDTGLLLTYGPMADFISATFAIPLSLFVITGRMGWLLLAIWFSMSTLLANVRTGMGGIFLSTIFFLFSIFRFKSIPWIIGIATAALIIVFSVPQLREKMFVDKNQTISELSLEDANFETINSNARDYLWKRNLDRFFDPHPIVGSGLGIAVESMKKDNSLLPDNKKGLELLHSDYIQFLCDLGLIGLILFILFGLTAIIWIIKTSWKNNSPFVLKLTGGMALGTFAAVFFSMGYDNVISYTQQCYVFPFIFLGILMKFKDINDTKESVKNLSTIEN